MVPYQYHTISGSIKFFTKKMGCANVNGYEYALIEQFKEQIITKHFTFLKAAIADGLQKELLRGLPENFSTL